MLVRTALNVLAAGFVLLAMLPANPATADVLWRVAVCGIGFGMFQSPNNRALVSSAPRSRSGAAGGMLGTARLFGQALGAAGVALLFGAHPQQGSNVALTVAAGIALLAAVVSMVRMSGASSAPPREATPSEL